jgi:tight adherence protein C
MRSLGLLMVLAVLSLGSLALLLAMLWSRRSTQIQERLRRVVGEEGKPATSTSSSRILKLARTPRLSRFLLPPDTAERGRLMNRLLQAGFYHPHALHVFMGVKVCLIIAPAVVGIVVGMLHFISLRNSLVLGLMGSSVGLLLPGLWLDRRKAARHACLRRALPDALDVIVICIEAGIGLQGAIKRVVVELETIHPLLAFELDIALREVYLGHSLGEALQHFAERSDLEELRSLASVVLQSEHLGVGVARGLKVHSEALRLRRLHRAEEMGQRAAVKILFPTLLCIFPAIFLVLAGPAVMQMLRIFSKHR